MRLWTHSRFDAMTETLQSPLHFLNYFKQRARYADQLLASQDLTDPSISPEVTTSRRR
ncbi:hypothetical protein SAMN05192544_108243 [Paraburkholderia hospita]|nr:hypothetical protein SAMN05192544_108243 [Paraburkholderia hospita]